MRFSGSDASETVDIAANGGRVRFFRNIASITMDLDDVERVEFRARGCADTIVVNDLSGTDLIEVNADLAAAAGGNAQPDTVIVNGTNGDAPDRRRRRRLRRDHDRRGGTRAYHRRRGRQRPAHRQRAGRGRRGGRVRPAAGSIQLTASGDDGDDILIGGDGDDIEIQSLRSDTVTSATAASKDWLAANTRIVRGRAVLEIGGKEHTLARTDLSRFAQP
jgi:hypothetical protein